MFVADVGGGQELVEVGLVIALDRDFLEEVECDVPRFAEGLDFLVAAGFLAHEVVGWESGDAEALVFVFLK